VYVPALAAGQVAAPVVFMFHGTSGDGEKFYNISGWKEKADAEGLIAVFPSALTYCLKEDDNHDGDFDDAGEQKVTTKWAAGKLGDPLEMPLCTAAELAMLSPANQALADHPLHDDVGYVDAMLDLLASSYVVDAQRIYASGFSNGASFTSRLALERADRFAAIAAASGSLTMTPALTARPLSFVFTIGEVEDGVLEALGIPALPMTETLLADYPVFTAAMVDPMLATLGLTSDFVYSEATMAGKKLSRFTFSTSTRGASNVLHVVVIEGATHQYPNGTNHPVVIVDPLWQFFSGESL
jgi:polyhydroxybutyrate depolymerase